MLDLRGLLHPEVAVIADPPGASGAEQREIEVAQRKERPAEREVRACPPPAPGQQAFGVFQDEDQEGSSGTGAPAFCNYFETGHELPEAVGGEAVVIAGILVERVAERRHQVEVATRCQYASRSTPPQGRM